MPDLKRSRFQHALLFLLLLLSQPGSASEDFAIVGINVVPMDEERLLENQVVVVSGGVIQSVSDLAATSLPAELLQIAGEGRYLMPGLADLHVHLRNADELVSNLAWGVTTVMHLGGSGEPGQEILRYREEIRNGSRPGPTIYATDRILDGDPAIATGALSLSTADEAKLAVRNLKAQGSDFVKIYNNVSLPVFTAIVAEAETQGLPVFGHIPRHFDALLALGGGQDAVVHTEEFFFTYFGGPRSTANMSRDYAPDLSRLPALIKVLVDHDVAVMPDLSFTFSNMLMWDSLDNVWNDPEFPNLHPDTASMWQAGNINRRDDLENFVLREQWKYRLMQTLTIEFQQADILQVIGTDASLPGLFPGKAVHRELTELVRAGLSNYDALAMATRNAGAFVERYLDPDARFGQIRPGYRADFVVLRDNPLQDVRNARAIDAVVAQGVYTDKTQLDARRAEQRARYDIVQGVNADVDAALQTEQPEAFLQALLQDHRDDAGILRSVESRINAAGYAAAFADELDRSERLLELNTRLFPQSANTWDSLAELVLYRGDQDRALELYRKALVADPAYVNAAGAMKQIQELEDRAD